MMTSGTLQLVVPQWQGGENAAYQLGARILAWLAPATEDRTIEISVPEPTSLPLPLEDGVAGRAALMAQMREIRRVLEVKLSTQDRPTFIHHDLPGSAKQTFCLFKRFQSSSLLKPCRRQDHIRSRQNGLFSMSFTSQEAARFLAQFIINLRANEFTLQVFMVSVAVLVDGDNFSGKHAALILKVAKDMGDPTVARVYADAQRQSEWHKAVGFRLIHAGTGKNASDLLLVIDAVELVLSKGIARFVIVSSDGDFTHLAQRLREHGAQVTGVGEAKAPLAFRAACNSFVEIGAEPSVALASKSPSGASDLDRKIRALIAEQSREGAGMAIMLLGQMMRARHGTRITAHGVQTWRAYLAARPDLYDLDPRGPDAKVRFRPAGFACAA